MVSFATIGAAWLAHTAVTGRVERGDTTFARLNLLLLLVVSFLAFPTSLVGQAISNGSAERVATTILGVKRILVAVVIALPWRHALAPRLGSHLALIAVGLFLPLVNVMGYLAIALVLLLPVRHHT